MRRLQQLGNLIPVDIACIESQCHPSPVAMMRRCGKSAIVTESLDLQRVGEEMQ